MNSNAVQAYYARLFYNGYDISDLIRSANESASSSENDATTFVTEGWIERMTGMKTMSITCEFIRKGNKASYQELLDKILGDGKGILTFAPQGDDPSKQAFIMACMETSHDLGGPADGIIGGNITFISDGRVKLGEIVQSQGGTVTWNEY